MWSVPEGNPAPKRGVLPEVFWDLFFFLGGRLRITPRGRWVGAGGFWGGEEGSEQPRSSFLEGVIIFRPPSGAISGANLNHFAGCRARLPSAANKRTEKQRRREVGGDF